MKRWRLILATLGVVVGLVVTLAIGSILVNVDWPKTLGSWLKALLGGLLLLISTVGITYAAPAVKAVIKDRGGARNDNRQKYSWVEGLGQRFTAQRAALSFVLAAAIFLAATLVPSITVPPPPSPLEPGVIRVMSAIDESERDPRFMLLEQWNNAHPANRVELITVPRETDAPHERMVADARDDHSADVYVLDVVWMPEFIQGRYIAPIDESSLDVLADDPFLTNVLDTCRGSVGDKDGLWALPFNSDAGLLYYRSDLVTTAPGTRSAYLGESAKATVAKVKAAPDAAASDIKAATTLQLVPEEILTVNALEAMWAAGGEVVDRFGRVLLNADKSEVSFDAKALTGLKGLAAAFRDSDIILPGSQDADELKSTTEFMEGHVLFMRNWPVAYDSLATRGDDGISVKVTSLPGAAPSVLGGQNLAISAATNKPRAAQELIEFLTSPSSQLALFEIGGFAPTRPSAYINSRRPFAQDLRSAVERARPRPALVHYTEFSREFRKGIARALYADGELEPDFAKRLAEIVKKG